MSNTPDLPHLRHSIRLQNYDYSSAGAYFVTLCVQNRECLFGEVVGEEVTLNDAGRMIQSTWITLPERFPLQIDELVVMPNHFHGIVKLNPAKNKPSQDGSSGDDWQENRGEHKVRPYGTAEDSLGRVLQAFKSLTVLAYIEGVKNLSWPPFTGKLWQRNYYERVIRNESEFNGARQYIVNNPLNWALDDENPENSR